MNVEMDIDVILFEDLCYRLNLNVDCPVKPINSDPNIYLSFESGNCFQMSLFNLAVPNWKMVNCQKPLVSHIFCQIEGNQLIDTNSVEVKPDFMSCLKESILKNNTCYILTWYKVGEILPGNCKSQPTRTFHIEQLQFLFDAVSDIFPPLFSPDLKYVITYKRYWNTFSYSLDSNYANREGMYVCPRNKSEDWGGNHVFRCSSDIYISLMFLCDGKQDCPGNAAFDEVGCECNTLLDYTSKCKISSQTQECSDFYFKSLDGSCKPYDYTFLTGGKVPTNSIPNEYLFPVQKQIQKPINTKHFSDTNKGKLSCQSTYILSNTLYEMKDVCSYKLNNQGHLIPCSKGEHLKNCELFECNVMFKCPGYYCIPWGYICDGKWDCPSGYDESIFHKCGNRTCNNMFKCKMSLMCLHLSDVCNGQFNCPYKDDESLCLLTGSVCPSDCQCLAFVIYIVIFVLCYNIEVSEHALPIYFPYIAVTILNCKIFTAEKLKTHFKYVSSLSVTKTNLMNICPVISFMKLVKLMDVSENKIKKIRTYCFKNKVGLRVIKLNNNVLQYIEKFAFHNSTALLYIDLSNNKLTVFLKYSIIVSENMLFVSLKNNTLNAMESKDSLNGLNIKFLRIERFPLCCFATENVRCSAKRPWYMSCSHLLLNSIMQYLCCVVSIVVIITNAFHIFLQKKNMKKGEMAQTFERLVSSISIMDILGTAPLFILWMSDLYFKDNLVFMEEEWKSSMMCFTSCGVSIYYGLASPFLYILLSYTRYDVINKPMDSNFKKVNIYLNG